MKKIAWIALPLTMAVGLAGCSTYNPYTNEQQTSSLAKGAGIGAAVGAVAGATKSGHHRTDKALIGAALGAAAGSGIGYYMDRQEAQLRQKMQGTGVSVTRSGDQIILNMPGSITFASDSTQLTPQIQNALNGVNEVLKEYGDTNINITGYTDSTGAASYNQRLSEQRAQSVGNYLAQSGVDYNRLNIRGGGEQNPIASNDTESGRAQNRRVELTLTPKQG
ncbi:OmpA family protein [Larsenimonas suaedae]|uniref:OmpA family protein n=1 Tax=Larsenimonas suaedae TaxID=1851019 RepID=A0ABU1GR45_9GAMM|nr:OmpA family protein [Larsenimonas suaedae]MCM2972705.1 OmpA family protein [Larsenimonas suaedae]MDR5894498.1 OmpA family protein [Larsenimonas suaedae]